MKRKFIFFTMLLLTLIGGVKFNVLNAQETVEIPTEGATLYQASYVPIYDYYNRHSISQTIYTQSEIGKIGKIEKIAYYNYSGNNNTRKISIYMKNIDRANFSTKEWETLTSAICVYDKEYTFSNSGWSEIELTTPFDYDGGNILVCVCDLTGASLYSNYDIFYAYETGSTENDSRCLYASSYSSFEPLNHTLAATYNRVNLGNNVFSYRAPKIKFTFGASVPSVKITPESIDLGTVRTDAEFFTEKPFDYSNYAVTVKAQGGAIIETNTIEQEGDFFKIVDVYNIDGGYQYHISYNQNGTTGEKEGTLVVTYKDSESATETKTATIPLSAVAYSSATDGEAIENPIVVAFTDNAYTHTATGMHDDYILPGEENDGNNGDAVYKFTLDNDAVLTASVTGNNPIVAIYNEDFGEKEGPSFDNNYGGVEEDNQEPLAETSFSYNFDNSSLEGWNTIDADGDGKTFGLSVASPWSGDYGVGGTKCIESVAANNGSHNNYIVTDQKYGITETSTLTFSVRGNNYATHKYDVVISTTDNISASSFTSLCQKTIELNSHTTVTIDVDLREYAGKNVYIGFRHYESSTSTSDRLFIDNIALTDGSAKSRSVAQTRSTNQIDRVLYPAGTYYLVAAADGDFTLNLSTETLTVPAAATLTAPANEATEQNNPLLTWTLDKFAEEYQLLLGTTNPPTDVVVNWSAPATSYQTEGLANNTVYYWQVKSKNSVGESSSEVFSFVTPLNKPTNVTASKTNLYPGDETTISWTAAEGATSYNVYVGETKVASEVTSPYTLSSLEYNVNPGHNVTVTANHTLDESAKSDAVVVKMTAKSTVTFTVKNAAGTPVEYASVRIYNGKDQYGAAIEEQTFTTNANGQVVEDLLYLYGDYTGYYYFEVTRAPYATYNYNSSSDYISSSNFNNPTYAKNITLQLAAPTGFVAESYNVYPEQNIVLSWNEVAEATSYKVYRRGDYSYSTYEYEYTELGETTDLTYSVETPVYNMNGVYYSLEAIYSEGVSKKVTLENPVKVTGYGSFEATVNVEGATMKLEGTDEFGAAQEYTIVADGNGNYAANEVLAGSYTATASAFGYNDAIYNVTVTYEEEASCNFVMTEKPTAPEDLLKDVSVAEEYGAAKVTWTGANNNTQKYNIYRRNVETGAVKSVAENHNDTYGIYDSYTDAAYAGLDDGTYQYGVTTMVDADEVILNEGFENGLPSGWNAPWSSSASWTVYNYSTYAHNGTYSAYAYSRYNGYTANITTAVIDLTQNTSAKLSFYYKNTKGTSSANDFYVKIKKETEANWEKQIVTGNTVANYTKYEMSLDEYVGNRIQLSFEVYTYAYAYTYLDDIVITGTKKTESAPVWSNTIKKGGIVFNNDGGDNSWLNPLNWSNGEVPANDGTAEVTIKAAATISSEVNVNVKYLAINGGALTINRGATLTVTGELVNNDEYGLTINDGAQVFHNSENVKARFAMDIVAPETWSSENTDGWQFIAAPFVNNTAPIANFTSPNSSTIVYDLYKYNGVNAGAEWDNQKNNQNTWGYYFENGVGYLASYAEARTAYLSGTLNNATFFTKELSYNAEKPLANFHLLGNPFTFDMDMNNATYTNLVEGYAVVNPADGGYKYFAVGSSQNTADGTIKVGDGFFVKATGEDPSFSYNVESKAKRGESFNSLNITATGNAGEDNVVINLAGKSEGFDKLQNFNDAIATVYVAEDGKNYGIYNCESDVQEIQLNFNANKMGNYTISIEPNGKFQTVTLVDRFTGIETNMLVEDYHFTAMSSDDNNRFIVKLVNGQQSADNSHFAYQSGEDLIVEVEGAVQIIDMLGRVVYSNDVESTNNRINVANLENATYIVRVINEEGVKVQKVVIY